jgi:serine/threonine protein kinase
LPAEAKHISERELHWLVFGVEDSQESLEASRHVESCPECQRRLDEFTQQDGFSDYASSMLGEYPTTVDDMFDVPLRSHPRMDHDYLEYLSPPVHPELVGRLGRYDIERVIGAGGMGIVLKGFDAELNRPVAIKMLATHLAHIGTARQRFAREARAAAAIVHEHIVAIHNVETDGKIPFLVMQYVAGESLQSRVDRAGPLSTRQVLRIGIQAAAGLAAAHEQGVIHRDIKPGNILLENGVERVLLTDFGLARTVDDASLTHTGSVTGTPQYMSPEQANGDLSDHRTDLFSLGSVLYYMATGRPPFRAECAMGVLNRVCHTPHTPVWTINSEIPDELSDVIDRLLEKKPRRRYANASDVKDALSRILSDLQQHGIRRRPRWVRTARRNSFLIAMLSILVVGGLYFVPPLFTHPVQQQVAKSPDTNANQESSRTPATPSPKEVLDTLLQLESSTTPSESDIEAITKQLDRIESKVMSPRFLEFDQFWSDANAIQSRMNQLDESLSSDPIKQSHRGVQQ